MYLTVQRRVSEVLGTVHIAARVAAGRVAAAVGGGVGIEAWVLLFRHGVR